MHDRRKKLFPRATDTVLFYVKDVDGKFTYQQLKEMREQPVRQLVRRKENGRMVKARDADGNVLYRVTEDRTIDNVWRIPCLQPADRTQRMGYPTQKPQALLERIVEASSQPGNVVLDPFCGCGTAIAAAQHLDRQWIGIDVTHLAVGLIKYRMLHAFGLEPGKDYRVVGEPTTLRDARQLALDDRHQFEHWALGLVGARQSAHGPGPDRGNDGQMSFQEGGPGSEHKKVLISVKSGAVEACDVRDLAGVVSGEKAAMGWLICLEHITKPMRQEAADAGFYMSLWGAHPRVQIRTVKQLLSSNAFDAPPIERGGTTFQKPRRRQRVGQGILW